LSIEISDINDNAPIFNQEQYKADLLENNYMGAVVLQVTSSDLDIDDNARVVYSLKDEQMAGNFEVEPDTGISQRLSIRKLHK